MLNINADNSRCYKFKLMSLEQDGAHLDDSDGCDQLFACASPDRPMFQIVVVI